jgi:hypothetical protein
VDLSQTGNAELGRVYDARLGRVAYVRRITFTRTRTRLSSSSGAPNGHLTGTHFLLLTHATSATPDGPTRARARASDDHLTRTLTLGPSQRVELLVAAAPQEPRFDAVSSDR